MPQGEKDFVRARKNSAIVWGGARSARIPYIIRGIVLCCAVLCCAVLCCAVLCCAVLCCAVLCCKDTAKFLAAQGISQIFIKRFCTIIR
jgi:hypothetical protein